MFCARGYVGDNVLPTPGLFVVAVAQMAPSQASNHHQAWPLFGARLADETSLGVGSRQCWRPVLLQAPSSRQRPGPR